MIIYIYIYIYIYISWPQICMCKRVLPKTDIVFNQMCYFFYLVENYTIKMDSIHIINIKACRKKEVFFEYPLQCVPLPLISFAASVLGMFSKRFVKEFWGVRDNSSLSTVEIGKKKKKRTRKSPKGLICLVWFDGISTFVGYLMPNLIFTYTLKLWFVSLFCWYTV